MKKGDLVFVYGTLRKGESADLSRTPGAEYIGQDRINGMMFGLGWYPGVKQVTPVEEGGYNKKAPSVVGEVFAIMADDVPAKLDRYEGYPNLYNRHQVSTKSGLTVWVYTYAHEVPSDRWIKSGNWLDRDQPMSSAVLQEVKKPAAEIGAVHNIPVIVQE